MTARTRVDRRAWDRMVRQYGPAVQAVIARENERSAKALMTFMKRIVPVETGTLRRSIRMEALGGVQQGSWAVHAGGPTTERRIGSRTYNRAISVGSGQSTGGASRQAGGSNVTWNYARLIEWGTKNMREDPYVRPSRTRVRRLHRNRVRRALNALARRFSGRP